MSDPVPERDQLLHEAATWFARMRGPEADASREAFEAWLKRGALHRQAYNRASEIFAMGKLLAEDGRAGEGESPSPPDRPRRRIVAWTLAGLAILLAASWLLLTPLRSTDMATPPTADRQEAPPAEILSTQGAGPRTARLADGSTVWLETGSELEVRIGEDERRLDLRHGQARFQVFRDARPFVVHAGGGRVVARGTVFEVGYAADRRVVVRLIEGSVEVTSPPSPASPTPQAQRLVPGQRASFPTGPEGPIGTAPQRPGAAPQSPEPDAFSVPEHAAPARAYHDVSVSELVAVANRGGRRTIRLADPWVGARRVSGRFRIDDTLLLAERLASLFDLAREDGDDGSIVLRPR